MWYIFIKRRASTFRPGAHSNRGATPTPMELAHVNGLTGGALSDVWLSVGSGPRRLSSRLIIIDGWLRCTALTAWLPGLYPLRAQPSRVWNSQLLRRQLEIIGWWAKRLPRWGASYRDEGSEWAESSNRISCPPPSAAGEESPFASLSLLLSYRLTLYDPWYNHVIQEQIYRNKSSF